ncbi:uncharacterized protein LOC129923565 [Biomphalaria glabrata]|uniref:Uncharacterized protein LOC129923565 n=1 Tax=Biomphalaria glabrata TaxID=6526 RepID=A0A9W2Z7W5_BIOGL|nr:uncharacterized protein LOC129923565 [Biomphalaria glabrata]
MAGHTSKPAATTPVVGVSKSTADQQNATRKISRQPSTASLFGLKSSLHELTKSFKTRPNEAVYPRPSKETSDLIAENSHQTADAILEGDRKSRKMKKRKGKLTFRDVVDMKMEEHKPHTSARHCSDTEQFKSLVYQKVKEAVKAVTADGEKEINIHNVLTLLRTMDIDTAQDSILDLLRRAIAENSGQVDLNELDATILKLLETRPGSDVDACVISAFKLIDHDEDGYISKSDIQQLILNLGQESDDDVIADMMKAVDPDQKGSISLKDFSEFLLGKDITARYRGIELQSHGESLSQDPRAESKGLQVRENKTQASVSKLADVIMSLQSAQANSDTSQRVYSAGSVKTRSFFSGNFVAQEDKSLKGLFDVLSTRSSNENASDQSEDQTMEAKTNSADSIKEEQESSQLVNNEPITVQDVSESQDAPEKCSRDGHDVEESLEDETVEDELLFAPEIYIKITQWKHAATKSHSNESLTNAGHNGQQSSDSASVLTQSQSSRSEKMCVSQNTHREMKEQTISTTQSDSEVGMGEQRNEAYQDISDNHNVDKNANTIFDAEVPNDKANFELDNAMNFESKTIDNSVNKPEYVQRWLSSPELNSPRRLKTNYQSQEPEVRGFTDTSGSPEKKFLSIPFTSKVDLPLDHSRSNFSDLRRSMISLPYDDSVDSESVDDASTSLRLYNLGVSLSYISETNTDTSDSTQTESNDSQPDRHVFSQTEHRPKSKLCRNCTSASSVRSSITPPNRIPLVCKTIELQEVEVNSPVTANLFSNRRKFGSLPKDVSKFIVFRKSPSPEVKSCTKNDQKATLQTYSSFAGYGNSKSSVTLGRSSEKYALSKSQSYSRNLSRYLKSTPNKLLDRRVEPVSSQVNDRIQSLESLLRLDLKSRHALGQPIVYTVNRSFSIKQNGLATSERAIDEHFPKAEKSRMCALDLLKIDLTGYKRNLIMTNTPTNLSFINYAKLNQPRNSEASLSLSRQLQQAGMTYRMKSVNVSTNLADEKRKQATSDSQRSRFKLGDEINQTFGIFSKRRISSFESSETVVNGKSYASKKETALFCQK